MTGGGRSDPQLNRRTVLKTVGATMATGAGMTAVSGSAAAAEPVDEYLDDLPNSDRWVGMNDVNWIVVHWTNSPTRSSTINTLRNRGLSYHYVVNNYNSPGYVTRLVPPEQRAFHAASDDFANDMNNRSIGISYVYDYTDYGHWDNPHVLREETLQSMGEVIRYLCDTYNIPKRMYAHPGQAFTHDSNGNCVPAVDGGIIGHITVPHDNSGDCASYQLCPGFDFIPDRDPSVEHPEAFQLNPDELMSYVTGDGGDDGGDGGDDDSDAFEMGEEIEAASTVNTREQPGLGDDVVAQYDEGEPGEIVNGPVAADGYTWWGIHWTDQNVWGWSVESLIRTRETPPAFQMDQPIHAASTVNTREQPGLGDDVVAQLNEGAPGKIVNGPVDADGYTWWGIHWTDRNVWGWSAEGLLAECPTFCHGTRVQATTDLNVRWGPSTDYWSRDTASSGDTGRVVGGPDQNDGFQWWEIEWDNGVRGWSALGDDWLVVE